MKSCRLLLAVMVLLSCTQAGHGMAFEQIGPDKDQRHPTGEQPGWPAGMIKILGHDSRVYSIWVNGNENFYFKATPGEIGELITLYSETRLRDHLVTIKKGRKDASTFQRDKIEYNVSFHFGKTRRNGEAETYEPTLTIYVDAGAHRNLSTQITIPDNIIVNSEVAGWEVKSKATKPNRRLWHAEVTFNDKTPAADFENGVSTKVTLWEEDAETGFELGKVSHMGRFSAAFSSREIANFKGGKLWLTLTVGNHLTAAKKSDPRLDIEDMSPDWLDVKVVEVEKPRFYIGRLLFEDGSPAILDPPPWPGGQISLSFAYAGRITIDEDGYFKVFFTPEQFETEKARRNRKNIYIPDFESQGRSTARYMFPVAKLSLAKEEAGEIRIPRARPEDSAK